MITSIVVVGPGTLSIFQTSFLIRFGFGFGCTSNQVVEEQFCARGAIPQ
jgi:hypothetical protein